MWVRSYSNVYEGIQKEEVWKVWGDIDNYIKWHDDLDSCKLHGNFAVGNYFILKPKGGPSFKVEITELIENKKFVDCTKFFGAKMFDIHELEETAEGLRITSRLEVIGWLSPLWVFLVAKKVAASAPKEMEATVDIVRRKHG